MDPRTTDQPAIKKKNILENIFVIFVLFLSTGAIIPLVRLEKGVIFDPVQGDPVMQGLWLGIYVITFILLFMRWKKAVRTVKQNKLLLLLVGLAFISLLWSVSPLVTLRRSLALLGSTAFGIYLASSYEWRNLVKMLVIAFGLGAVLSLGFVLLLPSYGVQHDIYYSGAWRGIYIHKNTLGSMMTLAAITWLLYFFSDTKGRISSLVFLGISMELLFLSRSKTSLIMFVFLSLPLLAYYYSIGNRRKILPAVLAILLIGSSAFLLIKQPDMLKAVSGLVSPKNTIALHLPEKLNSAHLPEVDPTFTGRTVLWQSVWGMIQQRPWLGYGYSAFWLGWNWPSGLVWGSVQWEPPNAHNGFLDLWLQLGLLGVVIFTVPFLITILKTFILIWKKKGIFALFPLSFLLIMLLNNLSETFILLQNNIFWILYVAVYATVNDYYTKSNQSNLPPRLKQKGVLNS